MFKFQTIVIQPIVGEINNSGHGYSDIVQAHCYVENRFETLLLNSITAG